MRITEPAPRLLLSLVLPALLSGCPNMPAAPDSGSGGGKPDLAAPAQDGPPPAPGDLAVAASDLASVCGSCKPPTPLCDAMSKRCVACLVDGDCPAATICQAGACVPGCSAMHAQCGDAGSCDVDAGLCHGCLSDSDCKDPMNPFCDLPSGKCGSCTPQNDRCPAGQYCATANNVNSCRSGCKSDGECQNADGGTGTSRCCNHVCADTAHSTQNCGGCGMACMKGVCCSGACADLQGDVANCGACGMRCGGNNIIPACQNGGCTSGGCVMGFVDCDNNPQNGCESNTQSDPKNCGGCGNACNLPNANALCIGGKCVIGNCQMGFRDCDGNPANGCEVNAQTNAQNCGSCGNSCANLPHAVAGCSGGACTVGQCAQGFANCNKIDQDGCESQLASDPNNCNGCGNVCPSPQNVASTCTNGVCGIAAGCNPGFADCNQNMADGCEINTQTDPKNCGSCTNVCAAFANAQPGCNAGVCGLGKCNPGFGDCDKNPNNGCELPLTNDNNNCGACGNVCGMNKMCINGQCTVPGIMVGVLGNQTFWKVQVNGTMTDTNVYNTCKAAGMNVGCQAQGNCMYDDNMCTMTLESFCGSPMMSLAQKLCNGQSPPSCAPLFGAFQYMGHHWVNDSACGAQQNQWCVQGSVTSNQYALCVQ